MATEIPDYLARLIDDIAVREGFVAGAYTVNQASGSKLGDNYMGVLWRVSVVGQRTVDGVRVDETLALICKTPPADAARREMFNSKGVFEREIKVYDDVLPKMQKFQEDKGIGRDQGFYQFPKCYGTMSDEETGNYALVLGDLKADGYEMWDRFEKLDFEHASLAIAELGKFHALSFVYRDQRPELLEQLKELKADQMLKMIEDENAQQYWKMNYVMAADTLNEDETELRAKMKTLGESFKERMHACMSVDLSEPFGVLVHGDFWNNNMMYRYKEGSKRPQAASLIDWQMTQFCSPATDLGYFLFSSTEHELREKHFWDIIQVYYDNVAKTIRALGSDPEQLFSFEDLRGQLKRFIQYGFLMAPMLVQVVTVQPDDLPDMDALARDFVEKKPDIVETFVKGDNPVYKKRMSEALRDYFAYGFDLVDL